MSLAPGARLGPYEIVAPIGAGGMGEVYRARDTRLDRTVAIKVLPATLASDQQLRDRFEREARAISSLQHPHVCALFDVGEAPDPEEVAGPNPIRYLVLEYLEGETVADRLTRTGPIPVPAALQIATDICDALDRAHRSLIVHRDLKPANVMLTTRGAKLLDFGLAKTATPVVAGGRSVLPTTPPALTEQGAILGTFQYMAPEQVEGLDADARTDIFAFGALVFEMLTGRPAFEGKTRASLLGSILKDDPPAISSLTPHAPKAIDRIVAICLAKDPEDRYQSARDLLRDLKDAANASPAAAAGTASATAPVRAIAGWGWLILVAVCALAAIAAGAGVRQWMKATATPASDLIQFTIEPPSQSTFASLPGGGTGTTPQLAVSPNGRQIVFVATGTRGPQLWLRSLDTALPRAIAGTDGAAFPFWSPDSRTVAFFAEGRLKKVAVDGGTPQVICEATSGRGGTWSRDDIIVFSPNTVGPLQRVSASGGIPVAATTLDEKYGDSSHRFPTFLPDGQHFLFTSTVGVCCPAPKPARIFVGALESTIATELMQVESAVTYAAGHVFFNRSDRDNTVMAQRFDPITRRLMDAPFPVAARIGSEGSRYSSFSVSETGVVAYSVRAGSARTQLSWLDREGNIVGVLGDAAGPGIALSPDETRVAVTRAAGGPTNRDIHILDARQGTPSRLTFDPGDDSAPIWSPDGSAIVFRGARNGRLVLLRMRLNDRIEEELLKDIPAVSRTATDWSADGRYLLYTQANGVQGLNDMWALPLVGDGKPIRLTQSPEEEYLPVFSPDGRWIAYTSAARGSTTGQVYVQPFPLTGTKFQISEDGGSQAMWSKDGRELFFINVTTAGVARFMSRRVKAGPTFELDAPVVLYSIAWAAGLPSIINMHAYAASRDGKRFLWGIAPTQGETEPLTVVSNWLALRK